MQRRAKKILNDGGKRNDGLGIPFNTAILNNSDFIL